MGPVWHGAAGTEQAVLGTEQGKSPVFAQLVNLCSSACFCCSVSEMGIDKAFLGLGGTFLGQRLKGDGCMIKSGSYIWLYKFN